MKDRYTGKPLSGAPCPPIPLALLAFLHEAFPPLKLTEETTLTEVAKEVGVRVVLDFLQAQNDIQSRSREE